MNCYAVIDTNVIVSALLKENSIPGKILEYIFKGNIIPVANSKILKEYFEVLHRSKFCFDREYVDYIIEYFILNSILIDEYDESNYKLMDIDDAVFYDTAIETRKHTDAYLITGNTKHFPDENFIVTPRKMLDIIEAIS